MTKSKRARRPAWPPSALAAAIPGKAGLDDVEMPVIQRPDGFYWEAPDGHQVFGPFESHELACADRDRYDEEQPAPGETLQQAQSELGIADWIDAETGEPAEGQSRPHLLEP